MKDTFSSLSFPHPCWPVSRPPPCSNSAPSLTRSLSLHLSLMSPTAQFPLSCFSPQRGLMGSHELWHSSLTISLTPSPPRPTCSFIVVNPSSLTPGCTTWQPQMILPYLATPALIFLPLCLSCSFLLKWTHSPHPSFFTHTPPYCLIWS